MKRAAVLPASLLFSACNMGSEAVGESSDPSTGASITPVSNTTVSDLPGQAQVQQALREDCPEIRDVECVGFDEEPTEFSCDFELAQPDGEWAARGMVIAIDGDRWINIGGERCGAVPDAELN